MAKKPERLAIVGAVRTFCEQETLRLLPYIARIAQNSGLPDPPFAIDDLVQEGAMAVFKHLPKYDPRRTNAEGRSIKVETWLGPRIKGAMLDYARQTGRLLHGGARTGRTEHFQSIFDPAGDHDPTPVGQTVADQSEDSPDRRVLRQAAWKQVLSTLNQRERLLVLEYFVHGRTLKEIGVDLGVGESRCSQMLTQVLAWLRRVNENDGRIRDNLAA